MTKDKIVKRLGNWFFELYMYIRFNFDLDTENENHRVYDHLGIIDTLGYNREVGKWTRHYSDEMICIWSLRIPFTKYWIRYIDGGSNYQYFKLSH